MDWQERQDRLYTQRVASAARNIEDSSERSIYINNCGCSEQIFHKDSQPYLSEKDEIRQIERAKWAAQNVAEHVRKVNLMFNRNDLDPDKAYDDALDKMGYTTGIIRNNDF